MTNGSEIVTTPAKSHANANSIAPYNLPTLTSPTGTEPALLIRRMGKVYCLHASAMQTSGLNDNRVMFRPPQCRRIIARIVST